MTITKSLAVVFVGAGLTASLLLLGQTWADTGSSPAPAPASTAAYSVSVDAIAPQAADRAALLQLCIAGQGSAEALAHYRQAAAAHPADAVHIGPDCTIVLPPIVGP